jgi:glycosyltransferase involved in cell wall biosynthesis
MHSLHLLAYEDQKRFIGEAAGEVEFLTLPGRRPQVVAYAVRSVWNLGRLRAVVRAQSPDVLFVPYQMSSSFSGTRLVLMLRNMEPFFHRRYEYSTYQRLRNYLLASGTHRSLRAADRVIAVSDFARDIARDRVGVRESRIRRIYHGRDGAYSPVDHESEDQLVLDQLQISSPFILNCAAMRPYSRAEDVIDAFRTLVSAGDSTVTLVLAGEGDDRRYMRTIRAAARGSAVSHRIRVLGFVKQELLRTLYRRCLFLVSATEVEACPNIMIEAMSSGCAILCADVPPMPEIIGDSAVYYSPRNVEQLARRMIEISRDLEIRDRLREKGLERAKHFSWERCADQTFEALVDW